MTTMDEARSDATLDPTGRDVARRAALDELSLRREGGFVPRRRRRLPGWLLLLLVLALAFGGYRVWQAATAVPRVRTALSQRISPNVSRELTTANGYVRARTRASVASKTQGRLVQVAVDEGDRVTAGQLLAVVDHDEVDELVKQADARIEAQEREAAMADAAIDESSAALTSAQALVDERRAALDAARASLAQAGSEYDRVEDLVRRDISSAADLDRAREARDVAQADVRRAEAAVNTAQKDVGRAEAARASSGYAREAARARVAIEEAEKQRLLVVRKQSFIEAPFAGVVLRREAESGEVVSPANTGAAGSKTAVVTLADFATLEIEVDVYERDIARISDATPCRVTLDAFPDSPLAAKVRLLRPTADRTRSTIQVYVAFDAVPDFARPEMVARVTFYSADTEVLQKDRVFVPREVHAVRDGKDGLFVLHGDKVAFVVVSLGAESDGRREVQGGIDAGETVVLDPPAVLKDGDKVVVEGT